MDAREQLAARQSSFVAALVAGAEIPAGMNADRVRIQAAALLRKRARSVALTAPDLAAALGGDFTPAFTQYAKANPRREGSAHDTAEFARYLLSESSFGRDRTVRQAARNARGSHRRRFLPR